jgi:nucleotide-binding universal stress UspA family protein
MKTFDILVPTDLSEYGNMAFLTAEKMRKVFGGVITPMHTFKEIIWPDGISMPNIDEVLSDEIKNQVAEKLRSYAIAYTDERYINPAIITYGDPFNRILAEGDARDLVVMTTHGRKGFTKALLGSVAEKMIRNSRTPVLVTRNVKESDPTEIKRILITTDFSPASLTVMPMAKQILENSDAEATILHIVSLEHTGTMQEGRKLHHKAELKLEELKENYFRGFEDRVHLETEVTTNSPQVSITKIIDKKKFDLLVLSTIGKSAFKYMLIGSNAASLIRTASCPVLVVQPEK